MRKFFPDKTILLFGFDFYIPETAEKVIIIKNKQPVEIIKSKCYDYKTDHDLKNRTPGTYGNSLNKFEKDKTTATDLIIKMSNEDTTELQQEIAKLKSENFSLREKLNDK